MPMLEIIYYIIQYPLNTMDSFTLRAIQLSALGLSNTYGSREKYCKNVLLTSLLLYLEWCWSISKTKHGIPWTPNSQRIIIIKVVVHPIHSIKPIIVVSFILDNE